MVPSEDNIRPNPLVMASPGARSIRHERFRHIWLVLGIIGVAACRSEVPPPHRTEVLRLVDSTVLQDGDGRRIARPSSVEMAPNGDIYVSDRLQGIGFRFARDGRFLNTIGSKGSGPGEFQSPRGFAFIGDSQVVAFDPGLHRAQAFMPTGRPIGEPLLLPFDFGMATVSGPTVWIGGSDPTDNLALLRWSSVEGLVNTGVRLPADLSKRPLLLLLGGAVVAAHPDTLILGYGYSDSLLVLNPHSVKLLDSFIVPKRARRGLTQAAANAALAGNGFEVLNNASSLSAIGFLPDGGLEVVYSDLTRSGADFVSKSFVTILNRQHHPICVDIPLPQLDASRPLISFHGDTLLIFEQALVGDTSVLNVLRGFIVGTTSDC